jgi:tRNA A37 threonylcarbamoyladenosine dehydratase
MTTEYYQELTRRNTGLISADTQERLRQTTVLVAGCGSTGGAVIEPLARIGVGGMALVEPGTYELNNLNRQDAYLDDIGRNKARTAATRVRRINPECNVSVHADGITPANAERLVRNSTIVVDGVDVTTRSGWLAKLAVHQAAARHHLTVVSGWDLASSQYVRIYRYGDDPTLAPLGGLTPGDVDTLSVWSLIKRLVPSSAFPRALA